MDDDRKLKRKIWAISLSAFAVFWVIDALLGAQLGIYPTDDSGPVVTTPTAGPSSPYPWLTTTPPPWKPAPRYTGPGSHCRDGTHSNSRGRGTCSHHGGVE
jgi:hypothetical protein